MKFPGPTRPSRRFAAAQQVVRYRKCCGQSARLSGVACIKLILGWTYEANFFAMFFAAAAAIAGVEAIRRSCRQKRWW